MSQTDAFIAKLESLKAGDLARLRQSIGAGLDDTVECFDLFTGLWWPLRKQKRSNVPERQSAWLVAKLYGAFPLPHVPGEPTALPRILRAAEPEPSEEYARKRYRRRFDALLAQPLARLEPHLRWALGAARQAVGRRRARGIDWVQLLDDLWQWDRDRDIQENWARQYLKP